MLNLLAFVYLSRGVSVVVFFVMQMAVYDLPNGFRIAM